MSVFNYRAFFLSFFHFFRLNNHEIVYLEDKHALEYFNVLLSVRNSYAWMHRNFTSSYMNN